MFARISIAIALVALSMTSMKVEASPTPVSALNVTAYLGRWYQVSYSGLRSSSGVEHDYLPHRMASVLGRCTLISLTSQPSSTALPAQQPTTVSLLTAKSPSSTPKRMPNILQELSM